jgi:hypothetical protein
MGRHRLVSVPVESEQVVPLTRLLNIQLELTARSRSGRASHAYMRRSGVRADYLLSGLLRSDISVALPRQATVTHANAPGGRAFRSCPRRSVCRSVSTVMNPVG